MGKTPDGMWITDRDKEFIRYLHAVKISTYERAKRDIYYEYHPESVANRIRKLIKAGIIEGKRIHRYENGRQLLNITKAGFKRFIKDEEIKKIELKSDSIVHDLKLVDIRYAIMNTKMVKAYHTENEVQTWGECNFEGMSHYFKQMNTDGVITIDTGREPLCIALEYENTQKTDIRYEQLLKHYYYYDDIPVVLYVARRNSILKKLKRIEREYRKSKGYKFYYSLEQAILQEGKLMFENINGDFIDLHRS